MNKINLLIQGSAINIMSGKNLLAVLAKLPFWKRDGETDDYGSLLMLKKVK